MARGDDLDIPYEKQAEGPSNRMCGAAALSMVYRSLAGPRARRVLEGQQSKRALTDRRVTAAPPPGGAERRQGPRRITEVTQADIWKRISKPGRTGSLSSATHLMVKDALSRGFSAVALQASNPLQMLLACRAGGIRTILNHRFKLDGPAGHFTVLAGMDDGGVVLHDPFTGPSQRVPYGTLLELWQPRFAAAEIVGNVLIGIADAPPRLEKCAACSSRIPAEAPCPQCGAQVPLSPSALVGCTKPRCIKRLWLRVCCPSCDFTFPLVGGAAEKTTAAASGAVLPPELYEHLQRFRAHVLGVPKLAGRADIQQLMASLGESEEKLKLGEHEEIARRAQSEATLQARLDEARKGAEEAQKARDAAAAPPAPVDGAALVAQLMRGLGLGS